MRKIVYLVALLVVLGIALGIILALNKKDPVLEKSAAEVQKLRKIAIACKMYSLDHDGQYPPDWAALTNYEQNPLTFVSQHDQDRVGAMSNVMDWTSFVYQRGISTASPPHSILAYLPPDPNGFKGMIIVFADGRVEITESTKAPDGPF